LSEFFLRYKNLLKNTGMKTGATAMMDAGGIRKQKWPGRACRTARPQITSPRRAEQF
jgi:hypothetical protein